MRTKAFLFMVLILCLATAVTAITTTTASPDPRLYVDPTDNEFTSSSPLGTEFTVSVKVADWTVPTFGFQLRLYWDATMLNATAASLPSGHWFTPVDPTKIFVVDGGTINNTGGYASFAATLLSPEQGKTGSGTIATVKLKIIAVPPRGENSSCTLELRPRNLKMVDNTGAEIPKTTYEIVNGSYVYSAVAPPTRPGDLNGDGKIDIQDIVIWGAAFGSNSTSPRWNPIADLNGDDFVDVIDAVLIAQNWTV